METMKFKYILLPFLWRSVVFIGGYTLLRYVFDIQLGWLNINTELLNAFLPLVGGTLVVYAGMEKRLEVLNVKENLRTKVLLVTGLMIGGSGVALQIQLVDYTRSFYSIENVTQMGYPRGIDCFRISNFELKPEGYSVVNNSYQERRTRGVTQSVLERYCVMPVVTESQETSPYTYWFVEKYKEVKKGLVTKKNKQYMWDKLVYRSRQDLKNRKYYKWNYLKVVPHSADYDQYLRAIKASSLPAASKVVMLKPEYRPYEENALPLWIAIGGFAAAFLVMFIMVSSASLVEEKNEGF